MRKQFHQTEHSENCYDLKLPKCRLQFKEIDLLCCYNFRHIFVAYRQSRHVQNSAVDAGNLFSVQMNAPLVLWTIVGGYYRETLAYAVAYLSL